MIELIKKILTQLLNDIDAGNSNVTEKEALEILDVLKRYTHKDIPMSKYQACKYLKISRATFDRLVLDNKIPKGKSIQGFKELSWLQKDLDKFLSNK